MRSPLWLLVDKPAIHPNNVGGLINSWAWPHSIYILFLWFPHVHNEIYPKSWIKLIKPRFLVVSVFLFCENKQRMDQRRKTCQCRRIPHEDVDEVNPVLWNGNGAPWPWQTHFPSDVLGKSTRWSTLGSSMAMLDCQGVFCFLFFLKYTLKLCIYWYDPESSEFNVFNLQQDYLRRYVEVGAS